MHASPAWITLFTFVGTLALAGSGLLWGRRQQFRGGGALAVDLGAVGSWSFAYGVSLGLDVDTAIAIRNFAQALVLIGPAALLVFAARYTGHDAWLEPDGLGAVAVVSGILTFLAVTNLNGWFLPEGRSLIDATVTTPGPAYVIAFVIATVWLGAASLWLLQHARRAPSVRRHVLIAITSGIAVSWLGSGLTVLHVFPFDIDATTLGLAYLTACLAYAVLSDRSAELRRVWDTEVVQRYEDGFLVFDVDGMVLHGNRAVLDILETDIGRIRHQPITTALGHDPELHQLLHLGRGRTTVVLNPHGQEKHVAVEAMPLHDDTASQIGTALHLRDVTSQFVDPLTGIGNRRYFFQRAQEHLIECEASERPAVVALLDLDHLKSINDSGGHAAGDAALQRAGMCLRMLLPQDAVYARIGGDEFAAVLTGCDESAAARTIASVCTGLRTDDMGLSMSAGLSAMTSDDTLMAALARADQALLDAKRAGRNRVQTWHAVVETR